MKLEVKVTDKKKAFGNGETADVVVDDEHLCHQQQQQHPSSTSTGIIEQQCECESTSPKSTNHGEEEDEDDDDAVVENSGKDGNHQGEEEHDHIDNDTAVVLYPPNPLQAINKHPCCWSRSLSVIFFWWPYDSLVRLGQERPLQDADMPTLYPIESSIFQKNHVLTVWEQEKQRRHQQQSQPPLLARALFSDYWKRSSRARWFLVANMCSRLLQTIALGRVLRLLENNSNNENENDNSIYLWAAVLVLTGLIAFPTKQHQFFESYRIGLQLRISLVAAIHDKILKLPSIGLEQMTAATTTTCSSSSPSISSGHVTNLASNDVGRFVDTAVTANFIVLGPIEACVILIMGIVLLGPMFAAGYALLLCILVPVQFWLSRRFATCRRRIARETDARVGLISQAVYGARVMKLHGWEDLFLQRMTRQRQLEIDKLYTTSRLKAWNEAIYYCMSTVVATFVLCLHVAFGKSQRLTPEMVYTTLTLLNILQFTLTKHIPNAIMGLSECYVSCQRLQAFLELPDIKPIMITTSSTGSNNNNAKTHEKKRNVVVSLDNVTCYWDDVGLVDIDNAGSPVTSPPTKMALSNISQSFQRGRLYCVIGKIGSSKSALLQAITGELPTSKGTIYRNYQSMSYAAQEPWIMNGTIRENILLGHAMDHEWYERVIDACALRQDLEQFPQSDETIVGDRGVQCSGGQKARIGLARALYHPRNTSSSTDHLLLLDDPLSAVDARVAKSIFFKAIQELGVAMGKCVILVTHQHQFVGMADECILMDSGQVLCTGTLEECQLASLSNNVNSDINGERTSTHLTQIDKPDDHHPDRQQDGTVEAREDARSPKESQEEKRETGIVKLETWSSYARSFGSYPVCVAFFIVFAMTQATLLVTLVLLGKWAEFSSDEQHSTKWFGIVGGTTVLLILLSVFRAQISFLILIRCSKRLHDEMAKAVLRAKISFFDTNPLGRILNRFSADVGIVDEILPLTIYDFLVGAFMFFGSVATALVVLPYVLLILPVLIYCFLRFWSLFVGTTRELKRLEGLSRSPIYAMLSETLLGISTIRANGSVKHFEKKFSLAHDRHSRAAWAFMASSRWFATCLDLLSFALLATATLLAVLLHHQGWMAIDSATLGLALTLLIQMANTNFPWMVRQSAEVTNQMVSVERILEFSNLESEAPLTLDSDDKLNRAWPNNGNIDVNNLSVRYRPSLPLALDRVNFSVRNGTRIGIVGRTGSGKSTTVQALFRLLEAEHGSITIDGVDIASVGLHRLRKRISIIPQAPTLFSGCSIRDNLDLFNIHSDMEIHQALEDAHLKDLIDSLPQGIHSMVSESGSNFSVGQRQLLCLARAILSKNKILILDEASANCDRHTDRLLQETLEKSFRGGTIIAVAHRLDTIMNSDFVLVMGNGRVLEQGSPKDLLADENSCFSGMAKSGGYKTCNK